MKDWRNSGLLVEPNEVALCTLFQCITLNARVGKLIYLDKYYLQERLHVYRKDVLVIAEGSDCIS